MSKTIMATALGIVLGLMGSAQASGDPQAGKTKAAACVACHGEDGMGTQPIYPRLAGQYEDYLTKALRDYKTSRREHAIMQGMAAGLSEQDIGDLAAYYANLP